MKIKISKNIRNELQIKNKKLQMKTNFKIQVKLKNQTKKKQKKQKNKNESSIWKTNGGPKLPLQNFKSKN